MSIAGQLSLLDLPQEKAPGRCVCWRRRAWQHARLAMITVAPRQSLNDRLPVFHGGPGGPEQWDAWTTMCDLRSAMCLADGRTDISAIGLADGPTHPWRTCDGQQCPDGAR